MVCTFKIKETNVKRQGVVGLAREWDIMFLISRNGNNVPLAEVDDIRLLFQIIYI